ncbi:MAG: class I SAM-dependent methyltransferase [Clostridia bacterium]
MPSQFRNENPDIQIFELDHPDTQRYKLERIRQLEWTIPHNVHYVANDFAKDNMVDILKNAGFAPECPALLCHSGGDLLPDAPDL